MCATGATSLVFVERNIKSMPPPISIGFYRRPKSVGPWILWYRRNYAWKEVGDDTFSPINNHRLRTVIFGVLRQWGLAGVLVGPLHDGLHPGRKSWLHDTLKCAYVDITENECVTTTGDFHSRLCKFIETEWGNFGHLHGVESLSSNRFKPYEKNFNLRG